MQPAHADDLALASRCAAGDRDAQRALFREHRARVHATLYRVLGSNRDMEDLVQEAFLEVFRSLAGFRGDAKLATWIDRVTARTAYRYLARRPRPAVHLEAVPEPAAAGASAERRAIARDAVRRLYRHLDRLEPKYRVPFALHVIDGRPLRDVARITGASLVATKTRVWRARRELMRRAARDPALAALIAPTARETAP